MKRFNLTIEVGSGFLNEYSFNTIEEVNEYSKSLDESCSYIITDLKDFKVLKEHIPFEIQKRFLNLF